MTDVDVEAIVDAVTKEVLATLAGEAWHECLVCLGNCVAHNASDVRTVVAAGATRISYNGSGADVPTDLAGYIDHTLLRADASAAEVDRMCDEAIRYKFASVCVNPTWVRRVADNLRGTDVLTCSVIGFPLGSSYVREAASSNSLARSPCSSRALISGPSTPIRTNAILVLSSISMPMPPFISEDR